MNRLFGVIETALHQAMSAQVTFGVQGGHTTASRRSNGLAIDLVLHVAGGKNAFYIGFGSARNCFDVTGAIHIQPALENIRVGGMTYGYKKSLHGYGLRFARFDILYTY